MFLVVFFNHYKDMAALSPACLKLGGFLTLVLLLTSAAALYLQPLKCDTTRWTGWQKDNLDSLYKLWTIDSSLGGKSYAAVIDQILLSSLNISLQNKIKPTFQFYFEVVISQQLFSQGPDNAHNSKNFSLYSLMM